MVSNGFLPHSPRALRDCPGKLKISFEGPNWLLTPGAGPSRQRRLKLGSLVECFFRHFWLDFATNEGNHDRHCLAVVALLFEFGVGQKEAKILLITHWLFFWAVFVRYLSAHRHITGQSKNGTHHALPFVRNKHLLPFLNHGHHHLVDSRTSPKNPSAISGRSLPLWRCRAHPPRALPRLSASWPTFAQEFFERLGCVQRLPFPVCT